jgi:hypothetical protein
MDTKTTHQLQIHNNNYCAYVPCVVYGGGELIVADFVFSFCWLSSLDFPSPGAGHQKAPNGYGFRMYLPRPAYSSDF